MIKQFFYSARERRIRSFWRLLITGMISFIAVIICSIVTAVIQLVTGRPLMAFLAGAPITLGFIFVSVALGGLFVDRRKLSDFGLRIDNQWLRDLAFGLTLGFVLVTGVVIIEFVAGWVHQADQPSRLHPEEPRTLELFTFVVLFLCVGIYEELAFRGYLLKNLAEGWNWRVIGPNKAVVAAVLVTSLLFGVVHGMNPHATATSATFAPEPCSAATESTTMA